eukprot:gene16815-22299_t
MDMIPVSWFHYRLLAMCGIAFMADAMEVSILSYLSTCAGDEWNLSDIQRATITSMVFGGQIIGSFFWGAFADNYGGFLSGAAPSYVWLLLFRAIVGFGIGGLTVPFDLLAEFLPLSHRGKYLIFIELFWTVGSMFVNGMAWAVLSSHGWRLLTYIIAVPVTLSFLVSIALLPESPRWLLIKGRNEEAEKILYNVAEICNYKLEPFHLQSIDESTSKDASVKELLKDPIVRKISILLAMIWMCFGFSYYGFRIPYNGVIAVAWIARMFAMGSSSTTWVATPELFPTEMRATGHSLCNSVARIAGILFIINSIAAIASYALPETSDQELDEVVRRTLVDNSNDSSSRSVSQLLLKPTNIETLNPIPSSYKSV